MGKKFTETALTVLGSIGSVGATGQATTNGSIWLSYIIFSPATAGFSSYGGMIDKDNFSGAFYTNVRKIIYQTNNFLFGVSRLAFQAGQGQNFST